MAGFSWVVFATKQWKWWNGEKQRYSAAKTWCLCRSPGAHCLYLSGPPPLVLQVFWYCRPRPSTRPSPPSTQASVSHFSRCCDVHTNNESLRNIEPFLVTKAWIWKTDRIDLVCDCFLVCALVNAPGREVKRSIKFDEGNVIRDVVVCQENIFINRFSLSHLPCHNLSEPQSSGSFGTWEHFCDTPRCRPVSWWRNGEICPVSTCMWAPIFPSSWCKAKSSWQNN